MMAAEDPKFVNITDHELREGAKHMYNGLGPEMLKDLRRLFPNYSPGHLAAALTSAETSYLATLAADRKASQPAPVYVYALQWETPVRNGMMRSPHSLDLPLVFDNIETSRDFVGPGPDPQRMANIMTDAWVAFARNGSPQTPALPTWPEYKPGTRAVMDLDLQSNVVYDPKGRVHDLVARARGEKRLPSRAPDKGNN
jgi:para-nitrobenzyl esterase